MVLIGKTACRALMNRKTRPGSPCSPAQTRLPPLTGYRAPGAGAGSRGETDQFLALGSGRAVAASAGIAISLMDPVRDGLRGRLELARQLLPLIRSSRTVPRPFLTSDSRISRAEPIAVRSLRKPALDMGADRHTGFFAGRRQHEARREAGNPSLGWAGRSAVPCQPRRSTMPPGCVPRGCRGLPKERPSDGAISPA